MTKIVKPLSRLVLAAVALPLMTAAERPKMIQRASGGLWEVSSGGGSRSHKLCVADPVVLSQFEHRGKPCTRVVIRDTGSLTEIHYTCAGGGFGRTTMTMITPRALRLETQGISNRVPFHYVLQARRIGSCTKQ